MPKARSPPPPKKKKSIIIIVETNSLRNIGPGKIADASEQTLLREAQQHLERARALDPECVIAHAFIRRVGSNFPNASLSLIVN
jgi:hypothetical protein